ncbi:hypothetical protein BC829DRAFT_395053, partial [Chytridium lagenaria]
MDAVVRGGDGDDCQASLSARFPSWNWKKMRVDEREEPGYHFSRADMEKNQPRTLHGVEPPSRSVTQPLPPPPPSSMIHKTPLPPPHTPSIHTTPSSIPHHAPFPITIPHHNHHHPLSQPHHLNTPQPASEEQTALMALMHLRTPTTRPRGTSLSSVTSPRPYPPLTPTSDAPEPQTRSAYHKTQKRSQKRRASVVVVPVCRGGRGN